MNMPIFYIVLTCLALISILISKTVAKQQDQKSYFLGNRQVGLLSLTLTFLATQLGGGAILGSAEAAFNYGWGAMYYALGISLGLFVLSLGLGAKFRKMQVSTIPELFTNCYQAKNLRLLSSVIIMISMFFILLALGVATRKFFYAIGVVNDLWFIAFWALVIFYTTSGGLNAVVKTDILQVGFVLIVFCLVLASIFLNNQQVLQNVSNLSQKLEFVSLPWTSWLLMPMLFTIIGQDMGQRCFAAKTPRVVSISTFSSGILLIASSLLPVSLGIIASAQGVEFNGASVLIKLVSNLAGPTLASLFAAAVLMAILSTADSLLCSISLNLNYDIFGALEDIFGKKLSGTWLVKLSTYLVGLSSILLSFYAEEIIAVMVQAYGLSVSVLFVPIIMAVCTQNPSKQGARAAFWLGLLSYVVLRIYAPDLAEKELIAIALSMTGYAALKLAD